MSARGGPARGVPADACEADEAESAGAPLPAPADPLASPWAARPADGGDGLGAAGLPLLRLAPGDWPDGYGAMAGPDRPSARAISNAVFQQKGDIPSPQGASDLFWVWGQFLDHDLALTEAAHGGAWEPIAAPKGDPWFDPDGSGDATIGFTRVTPMAGTGEHVPAEYANEITPFLDASNIYGSSGAELARLRGEGGRLRLSEEGLILFPAGEPPLTGDVRAGENLALSAMHALFTREHNRWVDVFAAKEPTLDADALFARARACVEAEAQAITFNEFLPLLLGEDAIPDYGGHRPEVDPRVSVEFSTAVYRLGHTLLSPRLERVDEAGGAAPGPIALRDAFMNPALLAAGGGLDPLFRGLAGSTAQALDARVVEDVRSFLFGQPGQGGFDLVALNIQRGRDLGIPSYNDLRAALGLDRAKDFRDVTSDRTLAKALDSAYGDVDRIDAWVGGVAEDAVGDGMVGELFRAVLIDQFTRLRDGDPFWSLGRGLDRDQLDALWATTLSDVIRANTGVEHVQDKALLASARQGGSRDDDKLKGMDGRDLLIGFGGDDRLWGRGGDDDLFGDAGDDRLSGGEGDDRLIGGLGGDAFVFERKDRGLDRVLDFDAAEGDALVFERATDKNAPLAVQQGEHVTIAFGEATVIVEHVALDDLHLFIG